MFNHEKKYLTLGYVKLNISLFKNCRRAVKRSRNVFFGIDYDESN